MIASDDFVLSSILIKVCLAINTAAYLLNHHTCVVKENAFCECENVKETSGGTAGDSK